MFKTSPAFSGFSVPDIAAAKKFYSETLGLEVKETPQGLELHLAGGVRVFIYPAEHPPAAFTILNFMVDDIDVAVDGLLAKGVSMERYDMPGMPMDEKGIIRGDGSQGPKAIGWFKDPAGNIIAVMQEK